MRALIVTVISYFVSVIILVNYTFCCKEALCASVVSKCLLIDACKCDVINCTCCKDCFQCLGTLFADCCECVDMCPKAVVTPSNLSATSHVEDLPDPLVELFNALTEEHDATGRWTTYTYPVQRDLSPFLNPAVLQNVELGVVSRDSPTTSAWSHVNCTVAFMAQCMPWNKCKNSCRSMGATSYRWFHDGCCQCVGNNCLNYGMNETRCMNCPRISTSGIVDEEYEEADPDGEQPRKHVDTTNLQEESPLLTEERSSSSTFPPPYGPTNQPKTRAKSLTGRASNAGKTKTPVLQNKNTLTSTTTKQSISSPSSSTIRSV